MPAARFAMPANTSAVARARQQVLATVRSWGGGLDGETADTLELIVSELVTNAVVHGGDGRVAVALCLDGNLLRVSAYDGSPRPPLFRAAKDDEETGRGLALVDALAFRHGWEPTPRGKRCWAELELSESSPVLNSDVLTSGGLASGQAAP
ncbi:ATP-binding protein [Streptomyces pathocidini]|uniref:ATP-binding protein n=1 Tax=Streptomyces pathocidini TaxID=1650571 RepID=A0ABW7USB7_9ACTN|nr:ATP-binding protein [Streptomyces pathocidini]